MSNEEQHGIVDGLDTKKTDKKFKSLIIGIVVVLGALIFFGSSDKDKPQEPPPPRKLEYNADCFFRHNGVVHIMNAPCEFSTFRDTFSLETEEHEIFLSRKGATMAHGFWTNKATKEKKEIGPIFKKNRCWDNGFTQVCFLRAEEL